MNNVGRQLGAVARVVTGGPAALWHAHQMHVDEYLQKNGGKPIAHREMAQALKLSSRLALHDLRVARRTSRLGLATVVTMPLMTIFAALIAYPRGDVALLVVFALQMLTFPLVVLMLPMRIRYGRRLRPRFA